MKRTFTIDFWDGTEPDQIEANNAHVGPTGSLTLSDAGGNLVAAYAYGKWASVTGSGWEAL